MIERTFPKQLPSPPPTNADRIAAWLMQYRVFRPFEPNTHNPAPAGKELQ